MQGMNLHITNTTTFFISKAILKRMEYLDQSVDVMTYYEHVLFSLYLLYICICFTDISSIHKKGQNETDMNMKFTTELQKRSFV